MIKKFNEYMSYSSGMTRYKNYENIHSTFNKHIKERYEKSGIVFNKSLNSYVLDGELFHDIGIGTFTSDELDKLNSTDIYVFNEKSDDYGGINTWWIGHDVEDSYEIHYETKEGKVSIFMTEHDGRISDGQYIKFDNFDKFFEYINSIVNGRL